MVVNSHSHRLFLETLMYTSILKKYTKRELISIRTSTKMARDKTQQIIDRLLKNKPDKIKSFKKKSGIVDLEKQLRFLNRSIDKLDKTISTK